MIFKVIVFLLFPLFGAAQFTQLKSRNATQDSLLDKVFGIYRKAQDSVGDANSVKMIRNFSDSADKYISLAQKYILARRLDSCIRAIHTANFYIVNTQVLLHLTPGDRWVQFPPDY